MPKKKILIVDDEEINLKILINYLIAEGYDIDTAGNGEEAVRKSKGYRPDLIILDIMMPVMDGYEACSHYKSRPGDKKHTDNYGDGAGRQGIKIKRTLRQAQMIFFPSPSIRPN